MWRWDQQEPFGDSAANEDPDGDSISFSFAMRFPGQYFDRETNLAYNVFRDYDEASGRYVEAEPLGLAVEINLYRYGWSNPLSVIDIDGRAPSIMVGRSASYGVSATLPLGFVPFVSISGGAGFSIRQCCNPSGKVVNQWLFKLRFGVGAGASFKASATGRGVAPLMQIGGFPRCLSNATTKPLGSIDIVAGLFSARYNIDERILNVGIAGGGGLSAVLNLGERTWVLSESVSPECCKPH